MKTLEEEALLYADNVIGFDNKNHNDWEDAQRHIINFYEQSKFIQIEKLKAQIEILDKIIEWSFKNSQDNPTNYITLMEVTNLKQQLKELEK